VGEAPQRWFHQTDASSEMSERKKYSAHTSFVDKGEQEIVNMYYINENNLYGCPHVQLEIGEERLIAVSDTGVEISLMPERIFEDLLVKGLRAPQLPVVNGALITAFGSRTKRIKTQALNEFEIDGVSYEQVFMIAPNLVPDAILGINLLKENNVMINLSEGSFKTLRDGSDCEHKFFYGSLPKNKVEVISNLNFLLNFSELQSQLDGKKNIVGTQTTHALIPMQQQSQKELLSICDEIKVDEVGRYARNRKTFVSNHVSRKEEAVPDRSSTREDIQIAFIVNMLCNNEVGSGEQGTETKICEIKGHLQAQEAELKLQTEAVDIRALSARDLHKKVNESDNLSHGKKESFGHMLSKYRAHFTSKTGLCNIFEYKFEVQCSEPIVGHTRQIPFPVRPHIQGGRREKFPLHHVCDTVSIDICNSEQPVYCILIEDVSHYQWLCLF
jgi:hypothetical protein